MIGAVGVWRGLQIQAEPTRRVYGAAFNSLASVFRGLQAAEAVACPLLRAGVWRRLSPSLTGLATGRRAASAEAS